MASVPSSVVILLLYALALLFIPMFMTFAPVFLVFIQSFGLSLPSIVLHFATYGNKVI